MTSYPVPERHEYEAAFEKLCDIIEEGRSSTSRHAAQFFLAIITGAGDVDIQGIAANFDRGNLSAVMTILSGFQSYHVPEFEDYEEFMRPQDEKARC